MTEYCLLRRPSACGQLPPCSCGVSHLGGVGTRGHPTCPRRDVSRGVDDLRIPRRVRGVGISTLAGALAKIARRPTSASGIENELPSTAFVGLRNVIVVTGDRLHGCLPAGVNWVKTDDFNGAPPMSWVEPSGFARLMNAVLFAFYLALLLGAAFVGPVLLLLAGQKAFALTRAVGLRSTLWRPGRGPSSSSVLLRRQCFGAGSGIWTFTFEHAGRERTRRF